MEDSQTTSVSGNAEKLGSNVQMGQSSEPKVKACVQLGGHQYVIFEGQTIKVADFRPDDGSGSLIRPRVGQIIETNKVLAIVNEDGIKVGSPYLENARVRFGVSRLMKGKKVVAFKFKKRKGYHKKQGYRQRYIVLNVLDVVY